MSLDDIVFQARVEDLTEKFFVSFERRIKQMEQNTTKYNQAAQKGTEQTAKKMGILQGVISGVTTTLAGMALQALNSFKQVIVSSTMLAARAETLSVSLNNVGANAGYTQEELAKYEEQLKGTGITTLQTRQIMIQLIGANLDLAKAQDLARAAQNLAVVAGTDSSQMFQRLTHAILTLNPAMLTDIGLNVNLQQAYKAAAQELGTNAQELDYATKKQIALNEVLRKAEPLLGTYEDAMSTAGKQAGSLTRHMEEFQLALGRAFQPVYSAIIQTQTAIFKQLRAVVEENEDALTRLGEMAGETLGFLGTVGSAGVGVLAEKVIGLVQALDALIGALDAVGELLLSMGTFLTGLVVGFDEAGERAGRFGTTLKQTVAVVIGQVRAQVFQLTEGLRLLLETFAVSARGFAEIIRDPFSGDAWGRALEVQRDRVEQLKEDWETFGQRAQDVANETTYAVAESLGLISDEADKATTAQKAVADGMSQIAQETQEATAAIAELNEKFAKEMAEVMQKRMREDIDRAIEEGRRWEDFERKQAEKLQDILRDAQKRRADIVRDGERELQEAAEEERQAREEVEIDHRRTLIDIETDYQRRLQDIQRDYQFELTELVRKNDAVAILRLVRSTNKRLEQEKTGRERNREDAQRDRDRELEDLRRSQAQKREEIQRDMAERLAEYEADLEERLRMFELQQEQERAELQRSLEQQREDIARHRAWEDADRMAKYQKELQELGGHLGQMENLTQEGLQRILEQHGTAIQGLDAMWGAYYQRQAERAAASWTGVQAIEDTPVGTEAWGGRPADQWEYQRGGMGIATRPTRITVAERGTPEAFAVLPVEHLVRHQFSDVNVNLSGVSPQSEQQLLPVIYDAFVHMAHSMAGGAQ